MDADPFVSRILDDEGLTADLDEPEAAILIESLLARVKSLAAKANTEADAWPRIERLCQSAHHIAAAVALTLDGNWAESEQRVRSAGLEWPSTPSHHPAELLRQLLAAWK